MVQGRQVWLCGEDPNPTPSLLSEGFFSDILQLLFQSLVSPGLVLRGYRARKSHWQSKRLLLIRER
jgi:hypothetical protein